MEVDIDHVHHILFIYIPLFNYLHICTTQQCLYCQQGFEREDILNLYVPAAAELLSSRDGGGHQHAPASSVAARREEEVTQDVINAAMDVLAHRNRVIGHQDERIRR
jgi:hypothetical protein